MANVGPVTMKTTRCTVNRANAGTELGRALPTMYTKCCGKILWPSFPSLRGNRGLCAISCLSLTAQCMVGSITHWVSGSCYIYVLEKMFSEDTIKIRSKYKRVGDQQESHGITIRTFVGGLCLFVSRTDLVAEPCGRCTSQSKGSKWSQFAYSANQHPKRTVKKTLRTSSISPKMYPPRLTII